jgi:putative toxin-antitoxin system antitoxin component (TIGR02293 family)
MAFQNRPIAVPKKGLADPNQVVASALGCEQPADVNLSTSLLLPRVTGVSSGNHREMLSSIRKGFKFGCIPLLEQELHSNRKELSSILSIPTSTLARRQKAGALNTDESDRVARLARLKDIAVAMMQGDNEAAINWLRTPLEIFDNETPIQHAVTEMGARDVEDLIGRIRHGVFS